MEGEGARNIWSYPDFGMGLEVGKLELRDIAGLTRAVCRVTISLSYDFLDQDLERTEGKEREKLEIDAVAFLIGGSFCLHPESNHEIATLMEDLGYSWDPATAQGLVANAINEKYQEDFRVAFRLLTRCDSLGELEPEIGDGLKPVAGTSVTVRLENEKPVREVPLENLRGLWNPRGKGYYELRTLESLEQFGKHQEMVRRAIERDIERELRSM